MANQASSPDVAGVMRSVRQVRQYRPDPVPDERPDGVPDRSLLVRQLRVEGQEVQRVRGRGHVGSLLPPAASKFLPGPVVAPVGVAQGCVGEAPGTQD